MGRMKWRVQEWLYLEELSESPDGDEFLQRAHGADPTEKWWKDAVNWFVAGYKDKFDYCFSAETLDELMARKKIQPRAVQIPYPAETDQDRQLRLQGISQVCLRPDVDLVCILISAKRIGSYIKRKSPNYKRNKSGKQQTSTSTVTTVTPIADLAVKSHSKATSTNGYR